MNINLSENDVAYFEIILDDTARSSVEYLATHIIKHHDLEVWFIPVTNARDGKHNLVARYNGIEGILVASFAIERRDENGQTGVFIKYVDLLTYNGFWGATRHTIEEITRMSNPRIGLGDGSYYLVEQKK